MFEEKNHRKGVISIKVLLKGQFSNVCFFFVFHEFTMKILLIIISTNLVIFKKEFMEEAEISMCLFMYYSISVIYIYKHALAFHFDIMLRAHGHTDAFLDTCYDWNDEIHS